MPSKAFTPFGMKRLRASCATHVSFNAPPQLLKQNMRFRSNIRLASRTVLLGSLPVSSSYLRRVVENGRSTWMCGAVFNTNGENTADGIFAVAPQVTGQCRKYFMKNCSACRALKLKSISIDGRFRLSSARFLKASRVVHRGRD